MIEANIVRCPDEAAAGRMIKLIETVRDAGDSIGGVIFGCIKNPPVGLGEPVFDKISADLGKAMLSINAVKGFEIGSGFGGVGMRGSEHNDELRCATGGGGRRPTLPEGRWAGFRAVRTFISELRSNRCRRLARCSGR